MHTNLEIYEACFSRMLEPILVVKGEELPEWVIDLLQGNTTKHSHAHL